MFGRQFFSLYFYWLLLVCLVATWVHLLEHTKSIYTSSHTNDLPNSPEPQEYTSYNMNWVCDSLTLNYYCLWRVCIPATQVHLLDPMVTIDTKLLTYYLPCKSKSQKCDYHFATYFFQYTPQHGYLFYNSKHKCWNDKGI